MNLFYRAGNAYENTKSKIRSLFAGASNPSSSADWNPVNENRNSKIQGSANKITARVDKLIDDFPYVSNIQAVMTSYTVGQGIKFNSRVVNDAGEVTATEKRQRQQIEDAISWANEELDIAYRPGVASGALQGWEMERMASDRRIASGESCFIIHTDDTPGRYIPFALQPVSTLSLTEYGATPKNGNEVYRGIEYEKGTGKIMAYHFDSSAMDTTGLDIGLNQTTRVPAEFVIFDAIKKSPGVLRGISPLAASVLVAHDFEDVFNSEIDAAKMTSKWLGTIKTDNPKEFMRRNAIAKDSTNTKYQQAVQNSLMQFMKPGEEMKWEAPNRPSNLLLPFTEIILRMMASNINFPYELISQNFTGMNYTVTRASRAHHEKMLRPKMKYQVTHVNKPIVSNIIKWSVLSGRINLPGYFTNPRHYERGVYQLPGLEPVDPFRQAKADAENLANLLMSPQEICARRGAEYEDVVEQYKAAGEIIEENGFDADLFMEHITNQSSTNTQSNGNADTRSELEQDDYELRILDESA